MKTPKWLQALPRKLLDDAITAALINELGWAFPEEGDEPFDLKIKLRQAIRNRAVELLDAPEFKTRVDAFARQTLDEIMTRLTTQRVPR